MSPLEERTNHALRMLDDDLRAGRTSREDYRRHRRQLFQHLRAGLATTPDVTVRRPTPRSVPQTPLVAPTGMARDADRAGHRGHRLRTGAVATWTFLLLLLAACLGLLLLPGPTP